jgi:WD40 repeat protein
MIIQWITRLSDFIFRVLFRYRFRYDIFISYARRDGRDYALKLRDQLQGLDFSCFLDLDELPVGSSLTRDIKRNLNRSATLVLVGSERALHHSPYVSQEVEHFLSTGRTVIPVDFGFTTAMGITSEIAHPAREFILQNDLTWIDEKNEALASGTPSLAVADSIDKLFKYTRRNTRVRGQWLAMFIFILLGAAIFLGLILKATANLEIQKAEAQKAKAEAKNERAKAEDEGRKASAAAAEALKEKSKAENAAKEAKRQESIALSNAEKARRQQELAERNARIAKSQELASLAAAQQETNPDLAESLLNEALLRDNNEQVKDAVRSFLMKSTRYALLRGSAGFSDSNNNPAYDSAFNSASYSPSGHFIVTAGGYPWGVRVWNSITGEQVTKLEGTEKAARASYTHDERFIIVTNSDETILIWDTANKCVVRELKDIGAFTFYSPDKGFLITGGTGNTARVWNTANWEVVRELKPHEDEVTSAAFSQDGCFIVTGSRDGKWRTWQTATGQMVIEKNSNNGPINSVAYSPDGRFIVTANEIVIGPEDNAARVWDASTGQKITEVGYHVRGATYSPDGRVLIAKLGGMVTFWDTKTWQGITKQGDQFNDVIYSPDAQSIITIGLTDQNRKKVRIWDANTIWDPMTWRKIAELEDGVGEVVYSPDKRVIITRDGERVRMWDSQSWQELPERYPGYLFFSGSYSPDGQYFIAASPGDSKLSARPYILRAPSSQIVAELKSHAGSFKDLAHSPDGRFKVTDSKRNEAHIRKVTNGQIVAVLKGHNNTVISAAYSPDGQFVVTSSGENEALIWNAATGHLEYKLSGDKPITSAAYSVDGKFIVTANDGYRIAGGTASVWDVATRQVENKFNCMKVEELNQKLNISYCGLYNSIYASFIAPSNWGGEIIIKAFGRGATGFIFVVNPISGQLTAQFDNVPPVYSLIVSPVERVIVTVHSSTARIWNVESARFIEIKSPAGFIQSAVFSPDGRYIVTVDSDNTARVWNSTNGQLTAELKGQQVSKQSPAFSPNGRYIVTVDSDNTARVWNPVNGQLTAELKGHSGFLKSAAFSPDGSYIVTVTSNGTEQVWSQPMFESFEDVLERFRRLAPRNLTPEEREKYLHEPPSKRPPNAVR